MERNPFWGIVLILLFFFGLVAYFDFGDDGEFGNKKDRLNRERLMTRADSFFGHLKKVGYIDADGSNIAVLKDDCGRQYFKCPVHMGVVLVPVPGHIDIVAEKE